MRFFRRRSDGDFDDEMESHLAFETERLVHEGYSEIDARALARRAFGNVATAGERFHAFHRWTWLEGMLSDVRYALRTMRRNLLFTAVAVVGLAVAIGVNTTAFSMLNALILRDFPGVAAQHRLASLYVGHETRFGPTPAGHASYPDFVAYRDAMAPIASLAAAGRLTVAARGTGEPELVVADLVSGNFFTVLGTTPMRGRPLLPADDRAGATPAVVLSHGYWQRALGGREDVVGSTLQIGGRFFVIVGVAPAGFFGTHPGELLDPEHGAPSLFIPLAHAHLLRPGLQGSDVLQQRDAGWLRLVARMLPGTTLRGMEARASSSAARIAAAHPADRRGAFAVVRPGLSAGPGPQETVAAALLVMSVPLVILLVACANLANGLLARGVQRGREIAIRLALGATRARMIRALMVESALLALMGAIGGVLFAEAAVDLLRASLLPVPFDVPVDGRVLLFTIGLAGATSLLFGLVPALRATRTDLATATKEGANGYRRSLLRNTLVVAQIATSVVLVTMAGLFVRSNLRQLPSATAPDDRIVVPMDFSLAGHDAARGAMLQQQAMERLRNSSGVTAVGLGTAAPFTDPGERPVAIGGESLAGAGWFDVDAVSGDWFAATGSRLLHGRLFSEAERHGIPVVAVVDVAFTRARWPDARAPGEVVGRTMRIGGDTVRAVTVIGVIATERSAMQGPSSGTVYLPGDGSYTPASHLYIRTSSPATAMLPAVRTALRTVDPELPLHDVRTLREARRAQASPVGLLGSGMSVLGLLAALLAAVGLFAMQSFMVAQRRFEIGVRLALGAMSRDLMRMVLLTAMRLAAVGIAAGLVVAAGVSSLLRALLYGLSPFDPATLISAAALLFAVAVAASAGPAWRAANGQAMLALRSET